ncbi:uncharacterized protein [Bemisia tabaci]|uniref:uncharacterized protein n=1 Tax=Bemisia tabaci TaxID=7038 RepID=UPI0008F9DC9E|nr:PREDICTED: uncharacterized protein LOC109031130 [Bemisia tabaci]
MSFLASSRELDPPLPNKDFLNSMPNRSFLTRVPSLIPFRRAHTDLTVDTIESRLEKKGRWDLKRSNYCEKLARSAFFRSLNLESSHQVESQESFNEGDYCLLVDSPFRILRVRLCVPSVRCPLHAFCVSRTNL